MGDGVGVPAFGEHRNRDDAADRAAKLVGLANGVHYFAEQFLVGDRFGGALVARPLDDVAAEAFNFIVGHGPKVVVERVARLELFAVDEQSIRTGERITMFVEVSEQGEPAVLESGRAVVVLANKSRYEIVDQLGGRRVVADDDKARRNADAGLFPEGERLFVVAVQRVQGGLKLRGEAQRVEFFGLATSLPGHLGADVLPKVPEHRHIVAGNIIGDRDARQLDDAAFDGVHQRKIADGPAKESSLSVA